MNDVVFSQKPQENYSFDNESFIVIRTEDEDEIISELCESVFDNILFGQDENDSWDEGDTGLQNDNDNSVEASETGDSKDEDKEVGKTFLKQILKRFPKPLTVVKENYHIDRSFRDTYYMYFSNQHFKIKRYSVRLSFFKGIYNTEKFYDTSDSINESLQQDFIGCCVINPLSTGSIGRTLINPAYCLSENEGTSFMRLSDFTVHIYGRTFNVRAFPYRMQDEETMCCVEVTLLNLLEYYSNSYIDYKVAVPSEIIEKEQKHSYERVLPARGATYPVLTKVLSEFGFSPRLYNISAIDSFKYSSVSREDEFRRWMHYYIESGIPVAVNLCPIGISGTGHSLVCIGHGKAKEELKKKAFKNKWIPWSEREIAHPLINSADFYEDYVVVDDNEPVYHLRNFKNLSPYSDMRIENLAVPLYKRMFLDAPNALVTIRSILHTKELGIDEWAQGYLEKGEDVIIRLFMASSHNYKKFRTSTLVGTHVKHLYSLVPMPRFVWVCELYRVDDYDKLMAFGEVVIDATSAPNRGPRSLILMHYPKLVGYRNPDQEAPDFDIMAEIINDDLFPGYNQNLDSVTPV